MKDYYIKDLIKIGDKIKVNISGYNGDRLVQRVNKGANTLWIEYNGNNYDYFGYQTIYPEEILEVNGVNIEKLIEKVKKKCQQMI